MRKRFYVLAAATMLAAASLVAQNPGSPATPGPHHPHHGMMAGSMPDDCKAMMAKHEQMMSDMQVMNAALDQKVVAMDKATGPKKVDAMAAVIAEMVAQRKQMQQKMMAMQSGMMMHMGAHMHGTPGSKADPVMDCPMMKGSAGVAQ